MSLRVRVIIASGCALVAVVLCLSYADGVRQEAERVRSEAIARYGGEVVELVVATEQIEAGTTLSSSNVTTREWLSDLAPTEAETSLDDVVGKEVTCPVAEGCPLTSLAFRADEEALEVPEGRVAVSLQLTDKLGISSHVSKGSKVNAYRVDEEDAKLVACDMEVLAMPQSTSYGTAGSQVTIAARSKDVPDLLYASSDGSLRLVLPSEDTETSATTASSAASAERASGKTDVMTEESAAGVAGATATEGK